MSTRTRPGADALGHSHYTLPSFGSVEAYMTFDGLAWDEVISGDQHTNP